MGNKSLHKQTQNFPQILNQIHTPQKWESFSFENNNCKFFLSWENKPKCTLKMTKIYYLKLELRNHTWGLLDKPN